MERDPGKWRTRPYTVHLSDGTTKSVYAASAEKAKATVQRHLERHGMTLRVVTAERWSPEPWAR